MAGVTQQMLESAAKKIGMPVEIADEYSKRYDPTPEKKYQAGILRWMSRGNIPEVMLSNTSYLHSTLTAFDTLVKKKILTGEQADINRYPEFTDFYKKIAKYRTENPEIFEKTWTKKELLALPGVSLFRENEEWISFLLSNPDTATLLSKDTGWCTKDPGQAEYHIRDHGNLHIIYRKIGKNLKKAYLHDNDFHHFTNTGNNSVQWGNLSESLIDILIPSEEDSLDLILNFSQFILPREYPEFRRRLSEDAKFAKDYAMLIRRPFPEGEKAIATDPYAATMYACYVLKSRFPAGEPQIATNGKLSLEYAKYALNRKRFPLGEKEISKEWDASYLYFLDVLRESLPKEGPPLPYAMLKDFFPESIKVGRVE